MSYYDEDFYEYPNEFEEDLYAFKEALASSVKEKYLEKMNALEQENRELREFKDRQAEYKKELERIRFNYEIKKQNAERDARSYRLRDLLKDFSVIGYRPINNPIKKPKCDKCDENRRIHFKSPSGKEFTEPCECANWNAHYEPRQVELFKFYAGNKLTDMYYTKQESEEYDRFDLHSNVCSSLSDVKLEELNSYYVVFLKEEDCKKYCEWLNERISNANH